MALRFDRDRFQSFRRFLWQRFIDDKCFETAGALSYTTLVSLVPLIVASLAIFAAFPAFAGARGTLIDFVFTNFVPAAGEYVKKSLDAFADNASRLTGISILVMFFSALSMMVSIEDRMNRIWRVQRQRGWVSRLLLYWAALTLGPVLIVGGGGAGLTASMLLSQLGVESLLVSAWPSTSILPKAHVLSPRTMEIFCDVGVADEIYAKGTPAQNMQATGWYAGLAGPHDGYGREIGRLEAWGGGYTDPDYIAASACRTSLVSCRTG